MAYEGDAAEQVIRIALSGGEVALRLTGSLAKNVAAFLLAMRQNNKAVYGRKSVKKLLQNTRDLRIFDHMTPEQFKAFRKKANRQKILYAGVGDKLMNPTFIDLMLPISEIERANLIFETIGYTPRNDRQAVQPEAEKESVKKKDTPSQSNSRSTRDKSTSQSNDKTNKPEKPSVTAKLEAFDQSIKQQASKPKARGKAKSNRGK